MSTTIQPQLRSKYNPINGRNPLPKYLSIPKLNKCKPSELATKSDFDKICKIHTIICSNNGVTTVLLQNLISSGHSIAKIYNCNSNKTNTLSTRKFNKVYNEYQVINHSKISEYFGIYFDSKHSSLIIHQQAYSQTLHQHISFSLSTNNPIQECVAKSMAKDILSSLWRLHNCNYVHCDIKPANIMKRELEHLYQSDTIRDGWLLIDFGEIMKHGSKGPYVGTLGWS